MNFRTINFIFSVLVGANFAIVYPARALVTGPLEISGKIRTVEEKTVELETKNGRIKVPRSSIHENPLVVGNQVKAVLSQEQFDRLISSSKKK
jgi:hypothetical protein